MAAEYDLVYTRDDGYPLASNVWGLLTPGTSLSFTASRVVNWFGSLTLELPPTFDLRRFREDQMIQVWRKPPGGVRVLWSVYPLRRWGYEHDAQGNKIITVYGSTPEELLVRRIVAGSAGTSASEKTDTDDDLLRAFVREAVLDTAKPIPEYGTRAWPLFSVESDKGKGTSAVKGAAFQELLSAYGGGLLVDISNNASAANDSELFWRVEPTVTQTGISFTFRVTSGQPGVDRTKQGVSFSEKRGNLMEAYYDYDATREVNYVYGLGRGEGVDREVVQVWDAKRIGKSRWNRRERSCESNDDRTEGVRSDANAVLHAGRPVIRAGGVPVDSKGMTFGRQWGFGDKVLAEVGEPTLIQFAAIVRSVSLGWSASLGIVAGRGKTRRIERKAGEETIRARLEYEGAA